jgi:hypothetical protein
VNATATRHLSTLIATMQDQHRQDHAVFVGITRWALANGWCPSPIWPELIHQSGWCVNWGYQPSPGVRRIVISHGHCLAREVDVTSTLQGLRAAIKATGLGRELPAGQR